MINDKINTLDITCIFSNNITKIKKYFSKLCKKYKTKYDYSSYCFNILNRKIKEIPVKVIYGNNLSIHIYTLATAVWIIVDKYIEDEHTSVYDVIRYSNLNEKNVISAEHEIFFEFTDLAKWIRRPRAKTI